MVKRRILFITAILAVMVAMTGIAAATDLIITRADPNDEIAATDPVSVTDGSSLILSLKLQNTPDDSAIHTVTTCAIIPMGGAPLNGMSVTCPDSLNPGGVDPSFFPDSLMITDGSANPGDMYFLLIAVNGTTLKYYSLASASRNVNNVPEFPAVALPIAAVIGLVFFFQQRREKK